jgi:hypothetical protein
MMTENSATQPIWKSLFPDNKLQNIETNYSKTLNDINHHYFHLDFPDTFEYKFFFLNALKGFLQSKQLRSSVTLNQKKIEFAISPDAANNISVSQTDWLRMDLVARLAGRVAEAIKSIKSIHDKVTIEPNSGEFERKRPTLPVYPLDTTLFEFFNKPWCQRQ